MLSLAGATTPLPRSVRPIRTGSEPHRNARTASIRTSSLHRGTLRALPGATVSFLSDSK